MQQIFVCFLFLLSAWLPASSYAQVAAPSSFTVFSSYDSAAGVKTLYFPSSTLGTPGTYYDVPSRVISPVSNPGVPMVSTDGGLPKVTQTGELINPSGNRVPVTATGRVSGLQASKIIGIALAKFLGPVGIGLAVYDVANELGFFLNNSSGVLQVSKAVTSGSSISDSWNGFPVSYSSQCASAYYGPCSLRHFYYPSGGLCGAYVSGSGVCHELQGPMATGPASYTHAAHWEPKVLTSLPSSYQALTDAVAAKSGWPSTSNISRLLSEHQATTGTAIQPEQISVTGPATSVGKTSTTTNSNNTTTTTTTTHNHTYEGAKVNTTNITTTTVTNTATGEPVSTQTTTEAPAPQPEPVETCGLPGKPICNVKVDESDVPRETDLKPEEKVTEAFKPIKDFATDPTAALPSLPALNWSFTLPSGCTALSIPAFAPYLQEIDICQFMPMFHDITSIVWLMGGLFGAISMFFRNTFAT